MKKTRRAGSRPPKSELRHEETKKDREQASKIRAEA